MKKLLFIIFLGALSVYAQNKNSFDVIKSNRGNNKTILAKVNTTYDLISNSRLSITLLPEGYYTIGTTGGLSQSPLDDNCGITFGHPYAKTSYPVVQIDGSWFKLDELFSASEINFHKNGDSLIIKALKPGYLSLEFSMVLKDSAVMLHQKLINLDAVTHKTALGFLFDPALGKWGDGVFEYDGILRSKGIILDSLNLPNDVTLWEKADGAKGIGVDFNFNKDRPEKFIAANWEELYSNPNPISSSSSNLYDLDIGMYWSERMLSYGEVNNCEYNLSLIQPDFPNGLVARWDIPTYLTLDNGIVFPNIFNSYLDIEKESSYPASNVNVILEMPSFLSTSSGSRSVQLTSFQTSVKIDLATKIKYEDKVEEIIAQVVSGGMVVDEIHKRIFMPATPVSDTGLVVTVDSLITSEFPNVGVRFHATKKSSGYTIVDLSSENIFLYEDGNRIENVELAKDTTGGVNAADIVFVLDVTGSMGDEITKVKNNINEFADSLQMRGVDYRLGMVTFLDVVENTYPFTSDINQFHQEVANQFAHGGGDLPENSLQALMDATKFPFRNNCKRIIIWITDASYHEADSFTSLKRNDVINALLNVGAVVNSIGSADYKTSYYDPIVNATGGSYFDIYGNFRDILLTISRLGASGKYLLKYLSSSTSIPAEIKLQIKYAGLGGEASVTPSVNHAVTEKKILSFYPNPFNPTITFKINMQKYSNGNVFIYNILGQLVKTINLSSANNQNVVWNAKNEAGETISTGLYIVHLVLKDSYSNKHNEFAKILFLK